MLVRVLRGAGAGHHLVMDGLVLGAHEVVDAVARHAQVVEALVADEVDLVHDDPVLHEPRVAVEHGLAVLREEVDGLARVPAQVVRGEGERHLVVRDGDHGLHAVLDDLLEEVLIELEAGLVGLGVVTVGEDARPVDGGAERLEAHAGQELQILLVGVVEVDAPALGEHAVGCLHGLLHEGGVDLLVVLLVDGDVVAELVDVGDAPALAVLIPGAFELVRGDGAAPQEVVGETGGNPVHDSSLLARERA